MPTRHHAHNIRAIRMELAANELTAIIPPIWASSVEIGNATEDSDLELHTSDDGKEYVVVEPESYWLVELDTQGFRPEELAFWLKSHEGGTVILFWS
jgi:hypothetical protein